MAATCTDAWPREGAGLTRRRLAAVGTGVAALGGVILLSAGTLSSLFGSQRLDQGPLDRTTRERRLDVLRRAVIVRMDELRAKMVLIGTTNAVATFLRTPDAGREAAQHDLSAFLGANPWCLRLTLARGRVPALTSAGRPGGPACEGLAALLEALSPGLFLIDRGPRAGVLCFAATLDSPAGSAVVAEVDPDRLIADVRALVEADEARLFLRDGRGAWLSPPPARMDLVQSAVVLPAWQGPAGGRWEIALGRAPGQRGASE